MVLCMSKLLIMTGLLKSWVQVLFATCLVSRKSMTAGITLWKKTCMNFFPNILIYQNFHIGNNQIPIGRTDFGSNEPGEPKGCNDCICTEDPNCQRPQAAKIRPVEETQVGFAVMYQSSFRSPSWIQPILRQIRPMPQLKTAGRMKQISAMASQSVPVMAAFAPVATSLTQPA